MNFGFTEEQELLRKTARDFLGEHASSAQVRAVMEGAEAYSQPLWRRMAELGWQGLAFPERFGGAGLSMVELGVVLEELGRCLAPVPFLPSMLAGFAILEAGDEKQKQEWLPRICSGEAVATLAITEERGTEEPGGLRLHRDARGLGLGAARPQAVRSGRRRRGSADRGGAHRGGARDCSVCRARRAGVSVQRAALDGRCCARCTGSSWTACVLPEASLLGANTEAWPKLQRVLDRGRVMICAEMVGGAEKCLEDSVKYAKERVQFGKPIGVNQAIKHKCADMLFEVESAKSITYYAAWAAREDNDEAPLAAAMAKAYVSDAYRHVSAENIQIHGGVGFTWEYDCHLYFKRAKSDEAWLGDGSYHRERVAQMLEL